VHKIRTYNAISIRGLDRFSRDRYEVASELPHPDAFLIRSQKLHDVDFPETLKAIGRAGAGVNNVPLERCNERGIVVFNAPGANANAVKELVLAGMLMGSRDIYQGMRFVDGLAPQEGLDALLEQEKKRFAGTELVGKTLGVVGSREHRLPGGEHGPVPGHAGGWLRPGDQRGGGVAPVQ
jgi:D-3-phosphoglycerate dehydrogenase